MDWFEICEVLTLLIDNRADASIVITISGYIDVLGENTRTFNIPLNEIELNTDYYRHIRVGSVKMIWYVYLSADLKSNNVNFS